ncbi:hypothetical protein Psta_4455 [Pirellula staleyi DSM 6068]|uniref:Uncharacterized protein n=1 Tax=Pirellula staleyi (strain ATCC 27377 / DSM 6068 / ICPB 4128) TaxID=530564 RepID=D2R614_PIRSD|nr:hypothetical protein Psta_4455 [Pirellula staleyi DSM 6068]
MSLAPVEPPVRLRKREQSYLGIQRDKALCVINIDELTRPETPRPCRPKAHRPEARLGLVSQLAGEHLGQSCFPGEGRLEER